VPGPGGSSDPTRDAQAGAELDEWFATQDASDGLDEATVRTLGSLIPGVGTVAATAYDEATDGTRDIPSAIGGDFDEAYDTVYDQPAYADDNVDLPGPSLGDAVGDAGEAANEFATDPRNYGPDWLDELTGVAVVGAVVLVVLYLVRPLLTIGANLSEGG
jgi:hypothetical protein